MACYACWLPRQLQHPGWFASTCRCSVPLPRCRVSTPVHYRALLLQEAEVIFAPYSYLLDPVIRRAMSVGALAGCTLAAGRLVACLVGRCCELSP